MNIVTYCITFPEEFDVLPNMIEQAQKLGPVWLVDGGIEGQHDQNPRSWVGPGAIADVAEKYRCYYVGMKWPPGNPGLQRNRVLNLLGTTYDWIIQNDSDELWTDQAVEAIPGYLASLPGSVTNVLVKMLHLVEDEDHYAAGFYNHLVHARIHRPGSVSWTEDGWHEHQNYVGERARSDLHLLHTKHLFLGRLQSMAGHGVEAWPNLNKTELPHGRFGQTWPVLHYPNWSA